MENIIWEDLISIKRQFEELLEAASSFLLQAVIGVLAILPRPRDSRLMLPKIMEFNSWLASSSQHKGFVFIDTFRTFTGRFQNARAGLFKDSLHLNPAGLMAFRDCLVSAISHIRANKIWA